jgi:uncharacterized RDD family membrane protein YckC
MVSQHDAAAQRYAPPTAEVADLVEAAQPLAGRGRRFAGALIDTLILLLLWWLVGVLTPLKLYSPQMAAAGVMTLMGYGLVGLLLFAATNGWLLAHRGQTVAKMLLGMRIVRGDGSAADLPRLLGLRYGVGALITLLPIVGMVYSLADGLMIFRADRRCIHDMIAGTIVVKT